MNRRVTFVTAVSVAGTTAVAAMSFAIVYEPARDPSAGVPLLDTTQAIPPDGSQGTDVVGGPVLPGTAPLPTSLNPAVPIVAAPVAATGATGAPIAPASATSGQGGRAGAGSPPMAKATPAGAPTGATTPTAPATSLVASRPPPCGPQPPVPTDPPGTRAVRVSTA